jgi:hypothetical protein
MYAASLSLLFGLSSCVDDWGKSDPPAGTDKYPKLEQVAAFDFEEDVNPQQIQLAAYSDGELPELVDDEELGSKVLHLNGGYAKFFNPFGSYELQEAASMTFLVKQQSEGALIVDENGNAVLDEDGNEQRESFTKDLSSALVCFQNANATQSLYITPNGGLVYDGIDGELTVNSASDVKTGMLEDLGEWHYVALSVTNTGYVIYVDGNKRVDQTVTDFDCSKIVQFISDAAYAYVGYGADDRCNDLWVDDLTFYRNSLTSKQTADPRKPAEGADADSEVYEDLEPTVGSSDCTTGWWSAFSNYFHIYGDKTLHLSFTNYTNMSANWDNFLVVFTNDKGRDESGYEEYVVLRADAYGWGNAYAGGTMTQNYDWDTFATDMNGAQVEMDITRAGKVVTMDAVITGNSGTVYNYTFQFTYDMTDNINVFLTCEGAYLTMNQNNIYYEDTYSAGTNLVGPSDCSAGWWAEFSDYYTLKGDGAYGFTFINNNTGTGGNWNNWLLGVTTEAERSGDGYEEYLILRSDAYGWASLYASGTMSHGFNWDTYVSDMHGATVNLIVSRNGRVLSTLAKIVTADGTALDDYTFTTTGDMTDNINMFLFVEAASLDMRSVRYYPYYK